MTTWESVPALVVALDEIPERADDTGQSAAAATWSIDVATAAGSSGCIRLRVEPNYAPADAIVLSEAEAVELLRRLAVARARIRLARVPAASGRDVHGV